MTLEDLCIPIAKIRLVADILDIEHYDTKSEHDYIDIPGQSVVGAYAILMESAREIEQVTRQEFDGWWDERKQYNATIEKLNRKINELEKEVTDAN